MQAFLTHNVPKHILARPLSRLHYTTLTTQRDPNTLCHQTQQPQIISVQRSLDKQLQRYIARSEWFRSLAQYRKYDPGHLAPVAPVLWRAERFRTDGLYLIGRVELLDSGVQVL